MSADPEILKTLYSKNGIKFTVQKGSSNNVIEHAEKTLLGTPGKLQYRLTNVADKIRALPAVFFSVLTKRGKTFGTMGLVSRKISVNGHIHSGMNVRYFSIARLWTGSRTRAGSRRRSELETAIGTLFTDPDLAIQMSGSTKNLIYAYVERGNQRSKDMSVRFQMEPLRAFSTMVFSRFYPRNEVGVQQLENNDQQEIVKMLEDEYSDHSCYTSENIDLNKGYYVLKNGNDIVAGAMFRPSLWNIVNWPGITGWILINILSNLPILKRLFNTNYKFLAVEGIVAKPGHESEIPKLLEGVCSLRKTHIAMLALDTRSELAQELDSQSNWGILRKLSSRIPVDILFRFNEFSEEEKLLYKQSPAYISTFDIV